MNKKIWITLVIILVSSAVAVYYRHKLGLLLRDTWTNTSSSTCSQFLMTKVESKVAEISNSKNNYSKISKDIMGLSTEGGVQTAYTDRAGNTRLINQTFYGETFRSELEYYLLKDKVFFISVARLEYEKPISVDSNVKIQKIINRDFYLNEQEEVCFWYLDKVLQQNDASTREFVAFLLSTLKGEG